MDIAYSQQIYPSNATFSLDLSAAEVHVSNDGRFLYASNRNLTAADAIQEGDVSARAELTRATAEHTLLLPAIRHPRRMENCRRRQDLAHAVSHGLRCATDPKLRVVARGHDCVCRWTGLRRRWRSSYREHLCLQTGQDEWDT